MKDDDFNVKTCCSNGSGSTTLNSESWDPDLEKEETECFALRGRPCCLLQWRAISLPLVHLKTRRGNNDAIFSPLHHLSERKEE
jgi:hypothetical protein